MMFGNENDVFKILKESKENNNYDDFFLTDYTDDELRVAKQEIIDALRDCDWEEEEALRDHYAKLNAYMQQRG